MHLIFDLLKRRMQYLSDNPSAIKKSFPQFLMENEPELMQGYAGLNHYNKPFRDHLTLPELLFESMNTYKNKPAIHFEHKEKSYATLLYDVYQCTAYLRQQKLTQKRVGVALERSDALIIVNVSILFLGGCFVPIDPTWSAQRIISIIAEADLSALVINTALKKQFSFVDIQLIEETHLFSEDLPVEAPALSSGDWITKPKPIDPAYIIFTSGSTGVPKGVIVRHTAMINLIDWVQNKFSLGKHDNMLCTSPITFDLALFDILGGMASGATLYLVSDTQRIDGRALAGLIKKHRISFWNSAPAVFQLVISAVEQTHQNLSSLRLIFLSGDWIPLHFPKHIQAHCPQALFVSLGGGRQRLRCGRIISL